MAAITSGTIVIRNPGEWNLNRGDNTDHIPEPHRVCEPAHGLLRIATPLSITGLIFMGLSQQGQPAEAACLDDREVQIRWLGVCDPFAFLLHEKAQPEVVKLGHGTHPIGVTLAVASDLPTPPDVAPTTDSE